MDRSSAVVYLLMAYAAAFFITLPFFNLSTSSYSWDNGRKQARAGRAAKILSAVGTPSSWPTWLRRFYLLYLPLAFILRIVVYVLTAYWLGWWHFFGKIRDWTFGNKSGVGYFKQMWKKDP